MLTNNEMELTKRLKEAETNCIAANQGTPRRAPAMAEIIYGTRNNLTQCMDLVEVILMRGFGEPPVARPDRDVNSLVDAVIDTVDKSSFIYERLKMIMGLLVEDV